ncbi:hypothetical protein [Mycolicibacterium mucogenicum]|uniref:Uncharacterized protein n=1 Tax=Mycolicibacterium mucogenicum DSM 44124 TaxID=1226753 RepID=A0A8H2PJT7_MYCMU|nr:hypothetical protein [Mycolicibacterium mucogenicum]KAB7754336.1 hypothetical protein MMUC44124_21965 [Mycolicibacterium mucogenicum DSM 44124]QPG68856.1 hypothetical protein C1S78_026135 [Mycolicibacterium mucogenicum DSM 44124]
MTTTTLRSAKSAAFAALLSTAALYALPVMLTAPSANASVSGDCTGSNQTYENRMGNGHLYEACTTTDKNGDKTKCSYVDGKAQGCIAVPMRKPKFNLDPSVVTPVTETPSAGPHVQPDQRR